MLSLSSFRLSTRKKEEEQQHSAKMRRSLGSSFEKLYLRFSDASANRTSNVFSSSCKVTSTEHPTKRVRFSASPRRTYGRNVVSSVHRVPKAPKGDRDELWWNSMELEAMRSRDSVRGDARLSYLSGALYLYHEVVSAQERQPQQQDEAPHYGSLEEFASGVARGYRGIERWHGQVAGERQTRSSEIIRKTVLLYQTLHKQEQFADQTEFSSSSSPGCNVDVAEQLRRHSRLMTLHSRRLAEMYGLADAMAIADEEPRRQ